MSTIAKNAKTIFLQAIEKHQPDAWPSFLDEVCGEDRELRQRVEGLLQAHEERDSLFDHDATMDLRAVERSGQMIGPYKLREQLGTGGMGVVWAAEQKQPLRRKVALKVIKPGMDSVSVLARFEAEREALAMMDHPSIARVLDAGTTEQGRPFFVMELICGVPIAEYCDTRRFTVRERLDLFMQVCNAVQHAHQKGIIHRDIKPSNVLVTEHDGKPLVKVIDFGVAKALHQPLTEQSIYTGVNQAIGTLPYMSPEQATLSSSDVDTRADIYGLGVLLYELLTGSTPFDIAQLEDGALDEACRIIREREPPKPSTKISTLANKRANSVSHARRTDLNGLGKAVRGDLDWVVMKALDKDRSRRYETASSFASDVQRFVNAEPIEARPPSAAYRLRKFVQRNKGLVATGLIVLMAILVGITGILVALQNTFSKNQELLALQEKLVEKQLQLRDVFIDQALLHAMSCDDREMEQALSNAELAGAPDSWRLMLEGLLAQHQGRLTDADRLLKEATRIHSDSVLANAMLASLYKYTGDVHNRARSVVRMRSFEATTDYERLFMASVKEFYNVDSALREIRDIVDRKPTSALARALLAEALVWKAWDTGDLKYAQEAIRETQLAGELMDAPIVYSTRLMACMTAAQLEQGQGLDSAQNMTAADEAASVLRQRFVQSAPRELAAYYDIQCNDLDTAIKILDQACKANPSPAYKTYHGALLYRLGRFVELGESFESPFALMEMAKTRDDVIEMCQNRLAAGSTTWIHRISLASIQCAVGEKEQAMGIWKEGRKIAANAGSLWNQEYGLRLLTGDWTPEDLLEQASGSKIKTSLAHFWIAFKCLWCDGPREDAIDHFEQCLQQGFMRIDCHFIAKAYLELLKDPSFLGGAHAPSNRAVTTTGPRDSGLLPGAFLIQQCRP